MSEGKKQNLKYRDTNIGYFLKIQSEIFQQVLELPNFHIVCCQLLIVVFTLAFFLRALNRVNCPVSSAMNFHHLSVND